MEGFGVRRRCGCGGKWAAARGEMGKKTWREAAHIALHLLLVYDDDFILFLGSIRIPMVKV